MSSDLVFFGGTGDLTWRKLVPALYNPYLDKWLPQQFAVIGVDQKQMSDDELRQRLRDGVDQFSRMKSPRSYISRTFPVWTGFKSGNSLR